MLEKAEKNRLAAMKRWIKVKAVVRHTKIAAWRQEYDNLGKGRTVGKRREWLANQMAMLTHEGVPKSALPGLFKPDAPKKKRDPDDVSKDLAKIVTKWMKGTLKLVPKDERPRDPNEQDLAPFEYRSAGRDVGMTATVEALLKKEKEAHGKLAERAKREMAEDVERRRLKKLKREGQGKKNLKAKAPKKKSRRRGAKKKPKEQEYDSEADEDTDASELDSDEEEEAEMDANYVFKADLKRALKASKAGDTRMPTRRQRRLPPSASRSR
jgi:hypothetical protein